MITKRKAGFEVLIDCHAWMDGRTYAGLSHRPMIQGVQQSRGKPNRRNPSTRGQNLSTKKSTVDGTI